MWFGQCLQSSGNFELFPGFFFFLPGLPCACTPLPQCPGLPCVCMPPPRRPVLCGRGPVHIFCVRVCAASQAGRECVEEPIGPLRHPHSQDLPVSLGSSLGAQGTRGLRLAELGAFPILLVSSRLLLRAAWCEGLFPSAPNQVSSVWQWRR